MDTITKISESISKSIEPVLINESPDGHTFISSSKGQEIVDSDPHDLLLQYLDDKNANEMFMMLKENQNNKEFSVNAETENDWQEIVDGLQQLPHYHQLIYNIHFKDLTYNLGNLEFNLQPNRASVYGDNLREVVATFSSNSQDREFIEDLIQILDTPCERQADCAFLQYFYPQINKPGNVCYSVGVESLLTLAPQAIVSQIDYITWMSILQNAFFPEKYEKDFMPRTKELEICICCLVLQQAKIPIEAQSDSCLLIRDESTKEPINRIVHFLDGQGESSMQYDTFSDSFNINGHRVYKINFPFDKYKIVNGIVCKDPE